MRSGDQIVVDRAGRGSRQGPEGPRTRPVGHAQLDRGLAPTFGPGPVHPTALADLEVSGVDWAKALTRQHTLGREVGQGLRALVLVRDQQQDVDRRRRTRARQEAVEELDRGAPEPAHEHALEGEGWLV
ncbi:MAG: hypothetical protein ACPG4T_17430 [Nannocystaceae bacterium]